MLKRSAEKMRYPFAPKSNAYLKRGQYWPVPLANKSFCCGVVLDVDTSDKRSFLAGLIDWNSRVEPTAQSIIDSELIEQGVAHIKAIQEGYGFITGEFGSIDDCPEPIATVEHLGGSNYGVYRGIEVSEVITGQEAEGYPKRTVWGYGVIKVRAEGRFGGR